MRIGLIARAENTGLGIQTWEFARHMHPAKTMIVRLADSRGFYPERFPGAEVVQGFPGTRDLERFVDGLDVVFTAETPYNYELFTIATDAGVASALQYNFEFLDYLLRPRLPQPTLFAAPSEWRFDEVHVPNKVLLPVPIATDRFTPRPRPGPARHFVHIAGRPAIHDRNGTGDLLQALQLVRSEITVTIKCQDPQYVPKLLSGLRIPENVSLVVDGTDTENYWDNYRYGDVLVMPRRFGGLCLPVREALAAGMPVIMPAISPNFWLPQTWLVPATLSGTFQARTAIGIYSVDHARLAAKIDEFACNVGFLSTSRGRARMLARARSWAMLKPTYEQVLGEAVARCA